MICTQSTQADADDEFAMTDAEMEGLLAFDLPAAVVQTMQPSADGLVRNDQWLSITHLIP
jgi:hypothetical protein